MRCFPAFLVAIFIVALFSPVAAEMSCDQVPAIAGATGYQRRANTERCEGFYQQQVSGALEILSFARGVITYDLVSDKMLIISTPDLSPFGASHLYLTARALRPGTYYRMDATVASAGTMNWPLSAVLAPANLHSIGVVAWINQDLGKYYVPISVFPENVVASASRPPIMILRSSLDVELLKWRSWPEKGGAKASDWATFGDKDPAIVRAGQPILLELKQLNSGRSVIEIAAKYVDQGRPESGQFRVAMP